MKTINILLFGESGAGKSTTINALANYLHYSSFDAAEMGQFVNVIPSRVTWLDLVTYDDLIIQDDLIDDNERFNDWGNSVTQFPTNYEFQSGDKRICIIDTPGMGDTGGLDVDKQNFKNILEHLKTVGELHGICFFIKTITTRKTAVFEYCLSELLIHLPRSASNNIMFCFTFSRNSFYGPGDGYETLQGFLKENKLGFEKINLKTRENCFFIDNEAFQYFLSKKNKDLKFTEAQRKSYQESWDKSVQQSFNMINRIVNFEPIKVDIIFALKECQMLIKELKNLIENLKIKIEEQTNVEQTKGTKRYGGNNHNGNNFNQKDFMEKQLEFIQICTRKLIEFLAINLNINCHNLIAPYLSLFENDGTETILLSSPFKRAKLTNEVGISADSMPKIANIIVHIRNKSYETIDVDYFMTVKQKLIDSTYWGNQIRKILGVEKRTNQPTDSRISYSVPFTSFKISTYFTLPETPGITLLSSNRTDKQYESPNFMSYFTRPLEIPSTQITNRNVPNQIENNTVHVTVDTDFNQVEPYSVRTEHNNNSVPVVEEQPIPREDSNLIPTTSQQDNEFDHENIIVSYEPEFEDELEKLLPTDESSSDRTENDDDDESVEVETNPTNCNSIIEFVDPEQNSMHESTNSINCGKGQSNQSLDSKIKISLTNLNSEQEKETQSKALDGHQNVGQSVHNSTTNVNNSQIPAKSNRPRRPRSCGCYCQCLNWTGKCIQKFFVLICSCC